MTIPGIAFRIDNSQHLTILDISFHYHPVEDRSPCPFRAGIEVTMFNMGIAVGMFNYE